MRNTLPTNILFNFPDEFRKGPALDDEKTGGFSSYEEENPPYPKPFHCGSIHPPNVMRIRHGCQWIFIQGDDVPLWRLVIVTQIALSELNGS
jgi:hypothetical protein